MTRQGFSGTAAQIAGRAFYTAKAAGQDWVACNTASPATAERAAETTTDSPRHHTHRALIRGGSP